MNDAKLIAELVKDEGLRLKPYKCTAGKTTIGVGRNLDDVGISKD
jgi:lysozyme